MDLSSDLKGVITVVMIPCMGYSSFILRHLQNIPQTVLCSLPISVSLFFAIII